MKDRFGKIFMRLWRNVKNGEKNRNKNVEKKNVQKKNIKKNKMLPIFGVSVILIWKCIVIATFSLYCSWKIRAFATV